MEDIKSVVAKNITELRLMNNMTQLELAERLNYSDKTISKWERGESSPDIAVLAEIATVFGVSLDYLVGFETIDKAVQENKQKEITYNRRAIAYLSEAIVWFVALFTFIIMALVAQQATFQWFCFVYALPVTFIIKLIFNSVWFNRRNNYYIISALIWSILAAIHITFLYFGINVALIYLLGVAGQIVIILCSLISKPKTK
ncbi:MAG: helix-turn-helix transcriptional regulator [Ruminococcaceae bacterium]|nr:helix-turn-helix transcriptional regulator [Oscillospiraceae bacterium]